MRKFRITWPVIGVALVLLAGTAIFLIAGGAEFFRPPTLDQRIDQLQAMAIEACRCDKKSATANDPACWENFNETIADISAGEQACACGPGSVSYHEIIGSKRTVRTEWGYGACSNGEIEAAKQEFLKKNPDWDEEELE